MTAEEFLKEKGISIHSVNATRFPHKYKNEEIPVIELMQEYAEKYSLQKEKEAFEAGRSGKRENDGWGDLIFDFETFEDYKKQK